ncbi:twinfilin-2-like isoform X2 [Glandiceps talaboti]
MSHQTGITISKDLQDFFAKSKDGSQRVIKVIIENEELVLKANAEVEGTWEDDFNKLVKPMIEDKQACYILYRLDTVNNLGYEWIMLFYVPDNAVVRDKMLYAGTKATLKMQFGGGHFKDDYSGNVPDDATYEGYLKHVESQNAPPPLTYAEEEIKMMNAQEAGARNIGINTRQQTMQGVSFQISSDAMAALTTFKRKEVNYVQLSIDVKAETIELETSQAVNLPDIPSMVPEDHPRYHLYLFKHTHEGDYMELAVFIYTMPGYKCSIKERMLYSSCKAGALQVIENDLGIEIAKKIEVDDAKELTEEYLNDQVHPKTTIVREKFAKPKGPPGRGKKSCILL